jgi:hypothetical protein
MAEVTTTYTLDDLLKAEGKEVDGASEVLFGIDGKTYEIDLVPSNVEKLRDALTPFLEVARIHRPANVTPRRRTSGEPRTRADRSDAKDVREWAASRDMKISARGRIPTDVQNAYDAAHKRQGQA